MLIAAGALIIFSGFVVNVFFQYDSSLANLYFSTFPLGLVTTIVGSNIVVIGAAVCTVANLRDD